MAAARELEDIERGLPRHTHEHPPVRNINQEADRRLGRTGQVAADLARVIGSWSFFAAQVVLVVAWLVLNGIAWLRHWDAYPFQLLDTVLTIEVALSVPLVLMALNRAADRDRLAAEQQFQDAVKAEEELKALMRHLEVQDEVLLQAIQRLDRSDRQLRRVVRRLGLDEDQG